MNRVYCDKCGCVFNYDITKDCPLCNLKVKDLIYKINGFSTWKNNMYETQKTLSKEIEELKALKRWKKSMYEFLSESDFNSISKIAEVVRNNEKHIKEMKGYVEFREDTEKAIKKERYKTKSNCMCGDTCRHEKQLNAICPKCIWEYMINEHSDYIKINTSYEKVTNCNNCKHQYNKNSECVCCITDHTSKDLTPSNWEKK